MTQKSFKKFFLVFLLLELFLTYTPAFAIPTSTGYDYSTAGVSDQIKKYLCAPTPANSSQTNNFGSGTGNSINTNQAAYGNNNSGDLYLCINQMYKFAIVVASVVGVFFIVIAGYVYISSEGNAESVEKAKSIVTSTVASLVILFGGYVFLKAINPDLIQFHSVQPPSVTITNTLQPPTTTPVTTTPTPTTTISPTPTTTPPPTDSSCPSLAISPITDPAAQSMENGQTVVWTSSDPNVQTNLTQLQMEYNKLKALFPSATVNSAYRPLAYQQHFYQIYQAALKLKQNPSLSSDPNCVAAAQQLAQEEQKHGVCYGNGPCLVGNPSCSVNAPHVLGIGIDIGGVNTNTINNTLQANGINLRWQNAPSDPVHFNLLNPPYTSCSQ